MRRKAQAALEFLMTYGWAILVVLVVIGALAYFGVLNPSILLPEKCTLQMGMYCKDHRIDAANGRINLKLENGMGKDIIITNISITGDVLPDPGCVTGIGDFTNITVGDGVGSDCDDVSCDGCPGWPGDGAKEYYYLCNPHYTKTDDSGNPFFTVESYNGNIGMRLPTGEEKDLTLNCSTAPLTWQGKAKSKITIIWYNADSSPLYSHTMEGELLATVEGN